MADAAPARTSQAACCRQREVRPTARTGQGSFSCPTEAGPSHHRTWNLCTRDPLSGSVAGSLGPSPALCDVAESSVGEVNLPWTRLFASEEMTRRGNPERKPGKETGGYPERKPGEETRKGTRRGNTEKRHGEETRRGNPEWKPRKYPEWKPRKVPGVETRRGNPVRYPERKPRKVNLVSKVRSTLFGIPVIRYEVPFSVFW